MGRFFKQDAGDSPRLASGTFTLFGQVGGDVNSGVDTPQTQGIEFSCSRAGKITAIWFNSPSGVTSLPNFITIWQVSGPTQLARQAPTWSGAAGSGWVRAPFSTPVSIAAATSYKACIEQSAVSQSWYGGTHFYWTTGAGQNGIASGPLFAPNNAGADVGQDSFITSNNAYPNSSFDASNYWVDVEVQA